MHVFGNVAFVAIVISMTRIWLAVQKGLFLVMLILTDISRKE